MTYDTGVQKTAALSALGMVGSAGWFALTCFGFPNNRLDGSLVLFESWVPWAFTKNRYLQKKQTDFSKQYLYLYGQCWSNLFPWIFLGVMNRSQGDQSFSSWWIVLWDRIVLLLGCVLGGIGKNNENMEGNAEELIQWGECDFQRFEWKNPRKTTHGLRNVLLDIFVLLICLWVKNEFPLYITPCSRVWLGFTGWIVRFGCPPRNVLPPTIVLPPRIVLLMESFSHGVSVSTCRNPWDGMV